MNNAGAPGNSHGLLRLAALAYTAFVIYGSLVPLDFQAKPLYFAWAIFLQLPWAAHGSSLTDWITNVVLYLPLAILWRSALLTRRPAGDWRSAGLVGLGCLALSAGLEFTQIFTASRTPLFNDILMNGLGAGMGILLWPVVAPRLAALADAVSGYTERICPNVPSARMPAGFALLPYLGGLGWAYGWFTSPWLPPQSAFDRLAGLHLAPFYQHYFADIGFALHSVGTVLAAYAPLGLGVWALRRRACSGRALLRMTVVWSLLAAGLFESSKLFLADRQPDYTNLLFAVMGGLLGCILACRNAPSAKAVASREVTKPSVRPSRGGMGWRILAAVAFGAALYGLWSQPFARIPLVVGALLYVLLLLRYPHAWLILIPGLLPVLDLAPWSGRFFFDEFDLALLFTLAVGYRHLSIQAGKTRLPAGLLFVLGLFAISCLISLALALFPLAPLDLNSFAHYYSPYNALRVAKGFFWALALLPLLARQHQAGVPVGRLFALGMAIGLAGTVLAIVWERAVLSGLTDFTRDFRVAGLMSSMHTGGSSIEAFLVLAMPFLAAVVDRQRSWTTTLAVMGLLLGGFYALAVTYARGGYVAMGLVFLVLVIGWMLRGKRVARTRTLPYVLVACLLVILMVAPILGGQFAQSRLAQSGRDAGVRMAHWQNALAIKDEGWRSELFGMGLGRYPVTYFYRSQEKARSASFSYFQRGGQQGLSLGAGTPVYVEQKVQVRHDVAYQLQVMARSASGGAGLNVLLCERTFFDSFGCTSATFKLTGTWAGYQDRLTLSWPGGWGRPVTLSLENFAPGSVAEIRSISLRNPAGRDVISNGDFSQGADRWFFSTFDHLGWHIKNLWVALLFEQGWMGLLAFTLLSGYALTQIAQHFLRSGNLVSLSVLAGLVGFLTVSVVDSLFDAPRLTLLFFLTLLVGCVHGESRAAPADKRVRRHSPGLGEPPAATRIRSHREAVPPYTSKLPIFWRDAAIGVGLLAMLGLAATSAPGMPYNVRELVYQGSPILSALLLSLFWFWLAGVPVIFAKGLAGNRLFRSLYLPATLSHAAAAAVLILMAVPSESIHDLVGSPILGWPGQIESMARLTALFAALSLLLTGGAWMARAALTGRRDAGLWAWGASALILLMLAHWVVVERAATDNLTELMAGGGGSQASVALTACILLLGTCGSLLSLYAMGAGLSRLATLIWVMLTLTLSYGLLVLGMETNVLKYGQNFSALQFLLSADRIHLVSGVELAMRYGLACCAGLLALAFAQWPFFRLVSTATTPVTERASTAP
ncbi:MAG: VanZ family protein [Thiobacillus sp.]|nr:VanZ family protein [Thiobacillus sp.]MDP2057913.1 VanZ family protein [Thiobacillus sp.]